MAEKLLTLMQDTTGDEIYPNVKDANLPPSVRGKLQEIDSKQDKLTDTQMYAVNSGITQNKVATYDGYNTTITKLNNDLTDAINEINNKQDKIFTSTVNPFSITVDNTGIDLHKITLNASGQLEVGEPVTQIPSDSYIQGELDTKQDTLVSGTNIKTLNGQSILGSGDLPIGLTSDYVQTVDNYALQNGIRIITNSASSSDQIVSYFYFDTINNNPILHTKNTDVKNYDLGKIINLFGKHPILVPNFSTDTNIDLYQHCINMYGIDQGSGGIDVYINVISSKNLNVDSLTDLKTLLGNTFLYSATGFYTTFSVYAINQDGFLYNLNGAEEVYSYADIDQITIDDKVTTI